MDRKERICSYQLGRRRLLAMAGSTLMALGVGGRVDSEASTPTPTATPAPSAAGTTEASPVGSPVASPVESGPIFDSTIRSLKFLPPEIAIEAGTTVVWTNNDVVTHTVTHKVKVTDQLFASPYLTPGERFSFTFEKPGTYPVYCIPHPFMTQSVVVTEKS